MGELAEGIMQMSEKNIFFEIENSTHCKKHKEKTWIPRRRNKSSLQSNFELEESRKKEEVRMCIHIKTWESFNQHFSSSECSAHKEPKKHNKQLELYSGIAEC